MALGWMDVSNLSFNTLLLLERVQLSWFPGWVPEEELGTALSANPTVEWYLRHKCPDIEPWLDQVMTKGNPSASPEDTRRAEETVLQAINDLVVYVVDPAVYDALPFLGWDSNELTSLVGFRDKLVIDVGAGTGRLAMVAAAKEAAAVFAVEPVANLRNYLKTKAAERGYRNLYPVDGLITEIPFPDEFADVTMGGHVFGGKPEEEYREMLRVTKKGGMLILCPGNNDRDEGHHQFLVDQGFEWSRFEEPEDGIKRKYWKIV
ncbi:MAG: methyltransferase domain-containing protein [Anaerolineales bacterium]